MSMGIGTLTIFVPPVHASSTVYVPSRGLLGIFAKMKQVQGVSGSYRFYIRFLCHLISIDYLIRRIDSSNLTSGGYMV